jgi:excisionase family DNA binding protein
MLRPREVAELQSLSRSEVYRLIDRGDIPSVRIGRLVRVPRRWVDEQAAVS